MPTRSKPRSRTRKSPTPRPAPKRMLRSRDRTVANPPQVSPSAGSSNGAIEEEFPEAAATTPAAVEPVGESRQHPIPVRFDVRSLPAQRVFIAGTFNNWQPDATEMVRVTDDHWARVVALPPGVHEYRLVVDGRWMTDPSSGRTVPNPFGETNSIMVVTRP